MVDHGMTEPKEANLGKNVQLVCLFCMVEIPKPTRVRGGGRISFCNSCAEKLERKGLLKRHGDGTIELMKPLLDLIEEF
jgi:hypothetical protein